jgi:hypothetical protein
VGWEWDRDSGCGEESEERQGTKNRRRMRRIIRFATSSHQSRQHGKLRLRAKQKDVEIQYHSNQVLWEKGGTSLTRLSTESQPETMMIMDADDD